MVAENNRLAKAFTGRGLPVLAFLDTHEPGNPEPPITSSFPPSLKFYAQVTLTIFSRN